VFINSKELRIYDKEDEEVLASRQGRHLQWL